MNGFLRIGLAAILLFTVSVCRAQTAPPAVEMMTSQEMATQEFALKKNGSLVLHRNGTETVIAESYTCSNGSKVVPDGTVIRKNGTYTKLNEGERVYKNGIIVSGLDVPNEKRKHS
jgi:hypothetical protein